MRHRKHRTRLNRPTGHRTATLRNLTRALVLTKDDEGNYTDRIETTTAKAKVLKSFIEKQITLGKKGSVHHRRMAFSNLQCKETVHRIFEELGPRYQERPGGYTRVIRTRRRAGDGAEMAFIEFVDRAEAPAAVESTSDSAV